MPIVKTAATVFALLPMLLFSANVARGEIILEPLPPSPQGGGMSTPKPSATPQLPMYVEQAKGGMMCPAPKVDEEPDPETPKIPWINKPPPSGPLPVDTEYTYFLHTNKKGGAYYCKRPLEGFLGTAMFTHHYICIIEGDEFYHHDPDHKWEKRVSCYGLTHADPSITPTLLTEYPGIIGGPPRGDTLEAGTCKLIKKVGRSCAMGVLQNISKEPVGGWGIGPGLEDCQEWAADVEDKLQDSCETHPGHEDY